MTANPQSTTEEALLEHCPFCPHGYGFVRNESGRYNGVVWVECDWPSHAVRLVAGDNAVPPCGAKTAEYQTERDAVAAWNTRFIPASAAPVVDKALYSELIHIAAELARGDGFLSSCAEDMNAKLKRADILKTAEGQDLRLKDWAYRIRLVANRLSAAATAAPVEQKD